ncbi:MAG TPA: thiol peroxidase, partial [Gammaproteobacteria bacterium]|nr:thiol peroxidase [Gammaproteobacteria bacterium]
PTCSQAMRHFNKLATQLPTVLVLCISADLPFAQKRFCGAENLNKVISFSTFRHPEFGQHYGVTITNGPMTGLLARAVLVIDENGKVVYTQQVKEISEEPDYTAVLDALK